MKGFKNMVYTDKAFILLLACLVMKVANNFTVTIVMCCVILLNIYESWRFYKATKGLKDETDSKFGQWLRKY